VGEAKKKPYQTPSVVNIGTLESLTQAKNANGSEQQGSNNGSRTL
jgi:hypothetical protein